MKKTFLFFGLFFLFLVGMSYGADEQLVCLEWDAVDFGEEALVVDCGIKINIGSESRNYTQIEDVGITTKTFVLISPGTYYIGLTAYNKSGESDYSNEITYTIEPPPAENPPSKPTIIWIKSGQVIVNENP